MGADLYMIEPSAMENANKMRPAFDSARKARDTAGGAQAAVDEAWDAMYPKNLYFRDSYNGTSVAWQLGFSWWKDVGEMLDDDGNLSPERCAELADRIEAAPPITWQARDDIQIDEENTPEKWVEFYNEKRERLVRFLRAGAATKGIECSI